MTISSFITQVATYYRDHSRAMPWRNDTTPYSIVVSEIMLQQTQVHRVMSKYPTWMEQFPDWQSLAHASTGTVLRAWSGLGYNRRALYLKQIAEKITGQGKTKGTLPRSIEELQELPGIGPNTAGAIMAYAYNIPVPFIETNIRSVFIHHFFSHIEKREGKKACKKIHDDEIIPLIKKSLRLATDPTKFRSPNVVHIFKSNPRVWYWALMDYGSYLKKQLPNPSRNSAHHTKQKPFKGSNRELRGTILKLLMKRVQSSETLIKQLAKWPREQVKESLTTLVKEGFIILKSKKYRISL